MAHSRGSAPPRRSVVIYCRVSTSEQAKDGLGLDVQEARTTDFCNAHELDIVDVIRDEGFSGKDLKRPGMTHLLGLIERGAIDAVAIHKLDRLTRSVVDFGDLLKRMDAHGVDLLSVKDSLDTETSGGRLVVNIMLSVSQWEREVIGERTKEALALAKEQGVYLGTAPVGWKRVPGDKRRIEPNEHIESVIRVHHLSASGMSMQQVADRMNADGIPTPGSTQPIHGRAKAKAGSAPKWHRTTVARALKAPLPESSDGPLIEPL